MGVLSAQSIQKTGIISPFNMRTEAYGMTYGLGPAGYGVRLDFGFDVSEENWDTIPPIPVLNGGIVHLFSTLEKFTMPDDVIGCVKDKSSWARRGLFVQNTVIEPGWKGYLTLELTNNGNEQISLRHSMPIAQIVFHRLDEPTTIPYNGKYQDQWRGPQEAK